MRYVVLVFSTCIAASPTFAASLTLFGQGEFDQVDCRYPECTLPGNEPITLTGTFAPFDPSLGTLESVRLSAGGVAGAGITLSDLQPGDYQYSLIMEYALLGPDGFVLDTTEQIIAAGGTTLLDDGTTLYPPHTGVPFQVFFIDGNSLANYPLRDTTAGLEYFLSSDVFVHTLKLRFDVRGPSFTGGTPAALDPDWIEGAMGVRGIYYTYTPIPEPSTVLLLGIGLALTTATMRRTRQHKLGLPSRR